MTYEDTHRELADILERYLLHLQHLRRPVAAEIAARLMPVVDKAVARELNTWVDHFDAEWTEVVLGGADYICTALAARAVALDPPKEVSI